jgi:hypothetical protein
MEPGRSGTATLKRTRRPSAASPRSITVQKSVVEANVDDWKANLVTATNLFQ